MKTYRLLFLLFVLGAFHLASNAQTKTVETGNFEITIPSTWETYTTDELTAMGLQALFVKDENAERIYMLFEMTMFDFSPEDVIRFCIMNNDMLKENAKWGDIKPFKYHSVDASKVDFTNTFMRAPRTGTAITFRDGKISYGIVIMAIPGYEIADDPVFKSFHLTGKGLPSETSTMSTRDQLKEMIDMFKDKWGSKIGEDATMDNMILHPTKNELTFVFSFLFVSKEELDEDTLSSMKFDLKDDMVEAISQMAESFPVIQRCKDENYTFILKYLDKNKQEL